MWLPKRVRGSIRGWLRGVRFEGSIGALDSDVRVLGQWPSLVAVDTFRVAISAPNAEVERGGLRHKNLDYFPHSYERRNKEAERVGGTRRQRSPDCHDRQPF